ncbi:MAG: NADH-quinone oxidoreductase subunit L [Alphaproteobacteria bacterium]|nr:NADH-quinone oxidoreductase subunit L [Alphaproteobacteria bacterium]
MAPIIVFGPLIASFIAGVFGNYIGHRVAQILTTGAVVLSAILSWIVFFDVTGNGNTYTIELLTWMSVGNFDVSWAIKVDSLSAVMLVVVNSVSALVHIYSWGYMSHDPHRARFFSYLSLFTFAMLSLVTADNFLQLFFGWEGVGLASYLLIGFWYKKKSANDAAIKAFVTNRVGDFGFALGIMALFHVFGSVKFEDVFAQIGDHADTVLAFAGMSFNAIELIAFLLFIGAMGKSAQFFLHVWLPDAMEGPTPVSALIHAATMVTAGVFLVCRAFPIYELAPATSTIVTAIGILTCFFAATVGMMQNDIKRVIAYSTCSQLGYMFFAAGLGLYSAAMFHLFTHAFFKALLFLGAGSVIHGLHDEQDMRKMGGTYQALPGTYLLMIIGTMALTGVGIPMLFGGVGLAGFYSKDMIIEEAFLAGEAGIPLGMVAFWFGVLVALMTSYYSWRVIFMTFHGKYRGEKSVLDKAHDSPPVMMIPLVLLAVGALFAGAMFKEDFVTKGAFSFWQESLPPGPYAEGNYGDTYGAEYRASLGEHHGDDHAADTHADDTHAEEAGYGDAAHGGEGDHGEDHGHHPPVWVLWMPFGATVIGFLTAWYFYITREGLPARMAAQNGPLYRLLYNKWYVDEIYHFIFVRGAKGLGDLFWKIGDVRIIDGLGPNGFAATAMAAARRVARAQSGFLYHYAFVMLIGVLGFMVWALAGGAGGQ